MNNFEIKKSHPAEYAIVQAIEPVLDEIVKLEKKHDTLAADHRAIVESAQRSLGELADRVDEVTAKALGVVAPVADELREDFRATVGDIKKLLDDQLGAITRASAEFDDRRRFEAQAASDMLIAAAATFGA